MDWTQPVGSSILGISAEDESTIAELQSRFAKCASQLAEGFYAHLLTNPVTAQLLQDRELFKRLKKAQMAYFEELVSVEYGEV